MTDEAVYIAVMDKRMTVADGAKQLKKNWAEERRANDVLLLALIIAALAIVIVVIIHPAP